ncbi:MAG: discoidin domain-containing protein, partial [Sedimentisphaerales bacterium]|nr:discoidin domain-containing protein [Sedimentisphaerales bacterium]
IEYDLGKVYRLYEMWVWNFNESLESVIGLGFKDVTIEYSIDGTDFTTLSTTEFAQAPGSANYAHDTTIDLSDIEARYVKLTANSNWGGILAQYGLSEVRFFYIPIRAREPEPAHEATGVALDATLTWTAGREAAEHNVFFSTDELEVIEGTVPYTTVAKTNYGPLSLDVGKTYYWRVDEVNDPGTTPLAGDIWSFTTTEFLVVDDFESYTDDDAAGQAIWQSWIDGFGVTDNGAQVGYLFPPYAEKTIVHSGSQSMPFAYDNLSGATNSEAAMVLTAQRDWTKGDVTALALWFRGNPASVGSFIEAPTGIYTMTAEGTDIWDTADEFHYAFQTLSGAGSIEAQVLSIQNTNAWAKAGVMIRETLDAGSKFAAVYITAGNGCRFQARTDTDIAATSDTSVATTEQTAITAPYWIKLERGVGGNCRGYYSSDGINWLSMSWNPQNISMNSEVYVGLALTSHSSGVTCECKFSNVRITGTVGAPWDHQDIGLASNDPEPMYVEISNSTGTPVVVPHNDPLATQIDTWTEWTIPLQDLASQGINLLDINKIAIGLGTKGDATASGGSGMMYYDDIRLK